MYSLQKEGQKYPRESHIQSKRLEQETKCEKDLHRAHPFSWMTSHCIQGELLYRYSVVMKPTLMGYLVPQDRG